MSVIDRRKQRQGCRQQSSRLPHHPDSSGKAAYRTNRPRSLAKLFVLLRISSTLDRSPVLCRRLPASQLGQAARPHTRRRAGRMHPRALPVCFAGLLDACGRHADPGRGSGERHHHHPGLVPGGGALLPARPPPSTRKRHPEELDQAVRGVAIGCENGVRPCGWTESSLYFDRLLGVLILELHRAEIAECRVQPS